jgi:hypothetical protein
MMNQTAFKKELATITKTRAAYITVQTTAFSGATLLSFLLNAHPQIATVAEMDGPLKGSNVESYLCSCGQKIKACEFWDAVTRAMEERGFPFDFADFGTRFEFAGPRLVQYLRLGSTRIRLLDSIRDAIFQALPGEGQQLRAIVARNDALIDSILSITGKDVFVDTSKGALRLRSMHKFSRFDVRVIHLIRDVRGVVASNLRRNKNTNVQEGAIRWVKLHRQYERALALLPAESYIQVRYEDLCQDVPGTLKRLYEFCGVDPEIEVTNFRATPQHIIGNKMRLKAWSEIKPDEGWREELTAEQLQQINRIASKSSRQYGYA